MALANGVIFQSFQWYLPAGRLAVGRARRRCTAVGGRGLYGRVVPAGLQGTEPVRRRLRRLRPLRPGRVRPEGTRRTKYGTRRQFLAAVAAVQAAGMQAYADVVFNHKDGGDEIERVRAQIVDWDNRNERSQRLARDRRLDALQLPRPRRRPLEHPLARGPLRRAELQRRHQQRLPPVPAQG